MSFKFEKLKVWQQGRKFATEIYRITTSFPQEEKFGLVNQLRRAAVSIVLNIAEGSNRNSDKEFIRFLRISIGSIDEVVAGLYIALDLGYVKKQKFDKLYVEANILVKRINALIKSIK